MSQRRLVFCFFNPCFRCRSLAIILVSLLASKFISQDITKIIVAFNDDSQNSGAGNRAAKKAEQKLLKYFDPDQVSISLPTGGDFGDMSKNQILDWMGKTNG